MEKRQQKTALVLKYAKRRFDGGQEADLIRAIERQNQTEQLHKMYGTPQASMGLSMPVPPAHAVKLDNSELKPVSQANSRFWETLMMGPLQVAIGCVGILTAGLAIFTFHRANNEEMLQQSKQVFSDCLKTLKKGLWDTLTTPIRVLKTRRVKV